MRKRRIRKTHRRVNPFPPTPPPGWTLARHPARSVFPRASFWTSLCTVHRGIVKRREISSDGILSLIFHVICISLFFSCARNAAAACLHFHHLASHCTQNLAGIQLVWDARCNAHQPHRLDCGEHWRRWRSAKLDTCISLCAGMIFTHHLF